jgi:hypothetical protein
MQGIVVHLNHQRGMYSVELSDGSYSVFELLDSNEIESGDVIIGALDELGSCTLRNHTAGGDFEAMVQNIGLNLPMAQNRTFLR